MIKAILKLFGFSKTKDKVVENHAFEIRIIPSWFSEDYVNFQYRRPNGTWGNIECCSPNTYGELDYVHKMERILYRAGFNSGKTAQEYFKEDLKKWDTLEKVKEYHAKQKELVEKKNASLKKQRDERDAKKKKFYS